MYFDQIIGYESIKQRLFHLIQRERLPQVQLISGPLGSPVLPFSLALASRLHCHQRVSLAPCHTCSSCKKSAKYLDPDLYFLFPLGGSSKSKSASRAFSMKAALPAWRDFLLRKRYEGLQGWANHLAHPLKQMQISTAQVEEMISFLRIHPLEHRYKVVILYLPECLSLAAANKLLKTLEEPPQHVFLILASYNPTQILPTISSRTFHLRLPPFEDRDLIKGVIEAYPTLSPAKAQVIARQAKGNLLLAYELAKEAPKQHFKSVATWLRSLYVAQWDTMLTLADQFADITPQAQKGWTAYALDLLHTTLRSQALPQSALEVSPENRFCQKLGDTLSLDQLTKLIESLEAMHQKLNRNAHPKLLFTATSLEVAKYLGK